MIEEMPLVPCCQDCLYGDDGPAPAEPEGAEDKWLLCRKRPPIVLNEGNDGFAGGVGVFPRVSGDDRCGEWRSAKPPYESFLERLRQYDDFEKSLAEAQ